MPRHLAPAVFAALVLATAAAFVQAQLVKRNNLVIDRVRTAPHDFTPNGDGRHDFAYIRFRLTRRDTTDVLVADRTGHVVRTLAHDRSLRPYHYWVFRWNGRTDAGTVAPAGAYHPRVVLHHQHRDLLLKNTFHLRRVPPTTP